MKIASWIVATHYRPKFLAAALSHLHAISRKLPQGWGYEIVVGAFIDDRVGIQTAHDLGCVVTTSRAPWGGGKRNAALTVCQGELVMGSDDDDFPSHLRPREAIAAYEAGHGMSGIREYRRLHLPSGMVTRWNGRGGWDKAPMFVTMARNYKTQILRSVHGWNPALRVLEDTELHSRIFRRHPDQGRKVKLELDLGTAQSDSTIFVQHDQNLVPDRPIVPVGKTILSGGSYTVYGEGHWSQIPTFPRGVAERLGLEPL